MLVNLLISALLVVSGSAASVPRAALTAYAPRAATCPTTPLVRPASGLSTSESGFISSRQPKSSAGLQQWLLKTNAAFGTSSLPAVALTTSGGGYRSLLSGAGVIQGLDSRDSSVGTSGVFQGLTYQAGLSGGAWLLSSFAGNNYPTVSSLKTGLWTQAFEDSLLLPSFLLSAAAYAAVTDDILAKQAAGFPPTLTDPYGRLLSYQLLYGTDGGVTDTLSGLTGESNFTSFNVPYPIIVSNGVETYQGTCLPPANATIYELAPYEFGSWDSGVSAFTQTKYLGSSLSNGLPTKTNNCTVNYDNLGYVLGTSSNLFNELCAAVPSPTASTSNLDDDLALIVDAAHALTTRDEYAVYPNPFYNYAQSSLVASQQALFLVDGGKQPLLQSYPPLSTYQHLHRRSRPKQPHLAPHPALPNRQRHHRQRQLRRHNRQLPQRHRNLPNLPPRLPGRPDQNARHPPRRHLRQPRPEQAPYLLRLQRRHKGHYRLSPKRQLHLPE